MTATGARANARSGPLLGTALPLSLGPWSRVLIGNPPVRKPQPKAGSGRNVVAQSPREIVPPRMGAGFRSRSRHDVPLAVEHGDGPLDADAAPEGEVQEPRGFPVDPGEQRKRGVASDAVLDGAVRGEAELTTEPHQDEPRVE